MSNVDQHVYLYAQRDNSGHVSWVWMYDGKFGGTSAFPPVDTKKGRNDIYINIVDTTGAIKFKGYPSDISQALWLSPKGSPTAKKPGIHVDSKDFDSFGFGQGGTQLKIGDVNGKVKDFVYQLNFVDTTNSTVQVPSIDPEIRNGDGSPLYEAIAIYVGAALVGAMLTVAFVRLALGWRPAA